MTSGSSKTPTPSLAVKRRVELVFKNISSAPLLAPNAARASGVSGVIYLDLGFVEPQDIGDIQVKNPGVQPFPKVNVQSLARLALSPEVARQMIDAILTQIPVMEEPDA